MYARPHIETHSRSRGQSAVAGAAYRLGVAMVDERTGQHHDFTRKGGVEWSAQICADDAPEWQRDPAQFWNRAEAAEKHPRAQVARDYRIPVPLGFDQVHAQALAERVARSIGGELGAPVSVALHRDSDKDRFGVEKDERARGYHAHIYLPARGVDAEGMAKGKTGLFRDLSNCNQSGAIIDRWAETWAREASALAQEQGLGTTYDHRSYERQGLAITPEPKMGVAAVEMERRGVETARGSDVLIAKVAQAEQRQRYPTPRPPCHDRGRGWSR